jgi:uroporphyrinogen decarboxylase
MMTAQERVMTALDHRPPDRLGKFDGFWGEFVEAWRKDKGFGPEVSITDYYAIDIAICVADETAWPSAAGTLEQRGRETISRDGWGRVSRSVAGGFFSETLESAINSHRDFETKPFESPTLDSRYAGFLQAVEQERAKRCVFCKIGGLYLRTAFTRGQTEFLMDLAGDPEFARAQIERMADHLIQIGLESLRRGHLWDTGLWIYDDMANNEAPMMSPATFERLFLPAYTRLIQAFKQAGARKVVLHCDGNLRPVLDMLLEAGIDGINPVEPKAGLDVVALKEHYGKRLAYVGGMCNAYVLPRGTREDIRWHVDRIREAARDGGIVIGTHSIGADVPVENYDYYHACVMGN